VCTGLSGQSRAYASQVRLAPRSSSPPLPFGRSAWSGDQVKSGLLRSSVYKTRWFFTLGMTDSSVGLSSSGSLSVARRSRRPLRTLALWLSACLIALLIMLPRLASPQFGLLDDGNSLSTAQLLASGEWRFGDIAGGRSRPLYWIFWALPYLITGPSPFWYFVANLASLIALVSCIFLLGRALRMGSSSIWLAAIIFLLTGPVVENFYTLSKGEPLQLILIVLAMSLPFRAVGARPSTSDRWVWAMVAALIFLAGVTKETVLVMIPIGLAWLIVASLGPRQTAWVNRRAILEALVGFLVGGACFLVYRVITIGPTLLGSGYASGFEFSVTRVLNSGSRWLAWLLRDFLFLVPLSVMPLVWRRKRLTMSRTDLLLGCLIWMAGWLAIFLPWVFVAEYYLLPFSLGAALFASIIVGQAVTIIRQRRPAGMSTLVLLVLAGLLFGTNLGNFRTVASLQLAVDRANSNVMAALAAQAPQGGTILINIQEPSEYVSQMGLQLAQVYSRSDVRVTYLDPAGLSTIDPMSGTMVAAPHIENQVLFSDRLGVDEPDARAWNQSIEEFLGSHSTEIYSQRSDVRLLAIDPARALCPLLIGVRADALPIGSILRYCQSGSLFDRRVFSYGWDVYRVRSP
jgi:hypothetical protein